MIEYDSVYPSNPLLIFSLFNMKKKFKIYVNIFGLYKYWTLLFR